MLIGVVATHPVESGRAAVSFVGGASRWVGYTAFADCGDEPPMDWITPKQCPVLEDSDPVASTGPGELQPGDAQGPTDQGEEGYVVRVDSNGIRAVLDQATETVVALHDEVSEIQDNGGLSVEIGDQQAGGGS
ncbi:MAG: hypothetical protein GY773_01645 [Actinomycetia bacterium]|nr:hypothetical protein [Actinomycetes bacterium]